MIHTAEQLEQYLNSDLPDALFSGSPRLWETMNHKLSYFRKRPDFRFTTFSADPPTVSQSDYTTIALTWHGPDVDIDLSGELFRSASDKYESVYVRAAVAATTMTFAMRHSESESGQVRIALGDRGEQGALSFCGNHPDMILIPDHGFLLSLGHDDFRRSVNRDWIRWSERKPVVFWRGQANGLVRVPEDSNTNDWSWLPRVHLCDAAARLAQQYPLDVRVTDISPYIQETYPSYVASMERFHGARVPPIDFMGYRYLIDIDGWANAWSGLFRKLLTGSVVLKVKSPFGFRQWYYDRLRPWEHYVPVASDLSDLERAIDFVLTNEPEAYAIGQRGREVALAATLESEMAHMAATVAAVQGSKACNTDVTVGKGSIC